MILSRTKFYAQQRYDLEMVLAEQSAARTDAKLYVKELISDQNYIVKGFALSGLGATNATLAMANAAFFIGGGSSDFSYFIAAPGASNINIPQLNLTAGARNYIELALTTVDNTPLTAAFWDPSANSGLGAEFNQTVNTMTDLQVSAVVLTGGFSGSPDRLPVGIIDCDGSGVIKVILDERNLFYRLGTPSNPNNSFAWASQNDPAFAVVLFGVSGTFLAGEVVTFSGGATATVLVGGTSAIQIMLLSGVNFASGNTLTGASSGAIGTVNTILQSFTGSDKDIQNAKQNDDAIKTEIKRSKGTQFWNQTPAGSIGGLASAINSAIVPISAGAALFWDGSALKITDTNVSPLSTDVIAKIRLFSKSYQISMARQDGQAGTSTISIANGQVLFVALPTSGNITYSGVGSGSTNFQVASYQTFALSDTNYWLAYREGAKLIVRNQGELSMGETTPIGDTVPTSLLNNIGLADSETAANYSSNIRGTVAESLVSRLGVVTDAIGDEQEDRSGYIRSDQLVTWDGTNLSFTSDIVLEFINTKNGTMTQHKILSAHSPIAISNSESIYALVNRSSTSENLTPVNSGTTPIPAQIQAEKDIFVFFRRVDAGGVTYIHLPFMKQLIAEGQSVRLGQSGSGSGAIKVSSFDPISATLPSGTSVTTDGVANVNGDTVLFTNLSSGNNEVYTLSGVGTSLVWTPFRAFNGQLAPTTGDQVVITKGIGFANTVGEFNGTTFKFNDSVRYFSGADYWEISSLKTAALADNTVNTVFSLSIAGSENMIMDYSVIRAGKKETGSLYITSDDTNVSLAQAGAYLTSNSGIVFSGAIVAGTFTLTCTTDSQGTGGTLKYALRRWSDIPGGPGGPPTYSSVGGGPGTGAAGSAKEIQFNAGSGVFGSDSRFTFDAASGAVVMNGMSFEVLSSGIILLDNQVSPQTIFAMDQTLYQFAIIEYSIRRGANAQVGRLLIANNGSVVSLTDDYTFTASTGITFNAILSGGFVQVQYTSTNASLTGTFKCTKRKWS